MSKAHRGCGIRDQKKNGRGTCPVCSRTGVKVLYEATVNGEKVNVCKCCNASLKRAAN